MCSGRGRQALEELINKAQAYERELDVRKASQCYEVALEYQCSAG